VTLRTASAPGAGAHRLVKDALRQLSRARYLRIVRDFEAIGMDGERQGEDQAAGARAQELALTRP